MLLEELALGLISGERPIISAIRLLAGVAGFLVAVIIGTVYVELSRSKYLFFFGAALLASAVIAMTNGLLPIASGRGYAWFIVAVSLLNALGTGYVLGLLSLWRAIDVSGKRWPAFLGLVPLVGLYLLFAPPLRGSRDKTPVTVVASLLAGGIVAGVAAGMISNSTAEALMRSSADQSTQGQPVTSLAVSTTELKAIGRRGFMATCPTSVGNQATTAALPPAFAENYCGCLIDSYHSLLTDSEIAALGEAGTLPQHVLQQREAIRSSCFDRFANGRPAQAPTRTQQLPLLNEIVVAGDSQRLRAEVQGARHAKAELGIALHAAAGVNNVAAIRILLAEGAPLDYAMIQRTPLIVAVTERNKEAVIVLLEAGADPNYVSTYDWRPLHYAINAEDASSSIIRELVAAGADPDARTNLDVTPLQRAASFCHADAVGVLAGMSADISLVDRQGRTAAQRADLSGCRAVAALLR